MTDTDSPRSTHTKLTVTRATHDRLRAMNAGSMNKTIEGLLDSFKPETTGMNERFKNLEEKLNVLSKTVAVVRDSLVAVKEQVKRLGPNY